MAHIHGESQTNIPPQASAWMAQVLIQEWESKGFRWERVHEDEAVLLSKLLHIDGLKILRKKDLECIWEQMEHMECFNQKRSFIQSPMGQNKELMAALLRRYFFPVECQCGVCVDKKVVKLLNEKTRLLVVQRHTQNPRVGKGPHCPAARKKTPTPRSPVAMPAGAAAVLQHPPAPRKWKCRPPIVGTCPTSGTKQPPPSRLGNTQQQPQPVEDESVPDNDEEARLFGELQQMGFTDKQEVLDAIRGVKFKKNSQALDSDTVVLDLVMLDLIKQREEKDKAREMDQAHMGPKRRRKDPSGARLVDHTTRGDNGDDDDDEIVVITPDHKKRSSKPKDDSI